MRSMLRVRETDPVKARRLAEDIQLRGAQVVVYIPFGQCVTPSAWRDNLDGLLTVPETVVFWNIRRKR
jgi:peptide/nickel transport system substrate-binding protein